MQRFGEKLRTLRKQREMTLVEVASALGYVSFGRISELEAGKKRPSLEFVLRVAEYFQVTPDQLLRDDLDLPPSDDA